MGRIERGYFISRYTADEIEKAIERSLATIPEDAKFSDLRPHVCHSCGAPMSTPFYCEYCGTHYAIGGGSGPTHNAGYLPDGTFCP